MNLKAFLTGISLLFLFNTYAQTAPAIEWQKSYGGSDYDWGTCISQTADGGYIMTAVSWSANGDLPGNYGLTDCWIIKLSGTGLIEWKKRYGGSLNDEARSIRQTSDGGYIMAGTSSSNDHDITGNHGNLDCWILKLNSAGEIVWQKILGGTKDDRATDIRELAGGGYIFSGYTESADGDVTNIHGTFNFDCWIVKLDVSGNIAWQKTFGSNGYETASSICETIDGGYIISGTAETNDLTGDVTNNHGNNSDWWVVKLNSSGSIEWQKCLGGSNTDYGSSMLQVSDGGYVGLGSAASTDGNLNTNHGVFDYWVVKLSHTGTIVWQTVLGGNNRDQTANIYKTNDGGYVTVGVSNSADGDVTGNHGSYDLWIVKLDSTGHREWSKSVGGSQEEIAGMGIASADGGYVIAGGSRSGDGDVTGNNASGSIWIVKLGSPALPLTLTAFSAKYLHQHVELKWQTATEINTRQFEIERSNNSVVFETIGKLDAAGNAAVLNDYSYTDINPYHGINYYRLKQVNRDGTADYSKLIKVTAAKKTASLIYPNPAGPVITIIPAGRLKAVEIFNSEGKMINQLHPSSDNRYNIAYLTSGSYSVKLVYSDEYEVIQLNKL